MAHHYRERSSNINPAGPAKLNTLRMRQLIFTAMARGLEAGLTPDASLSSVVTEKDGQATRAIITSLKNGETVTGALRAHRQGSNFDLSLVNIGETSGRLATVVQLIADRYRRILERKQRLRAKLRTPLFVGLLAIIVLPIPSISAGTLSPVKYLFYSIFVSSFLFTAWRLLRFLFIRHNSSTTTYPAHRFIGVPFIDGILEDYSTANFIERLHLLFASGFPIIDAIREGHESLIGFARRRRYRELEQDLHLGYSLADTFEHHEILSPKDLPILATGEAAGRLEESLARISHDTRSRFDSKIDVIITWIPRVVYLMVTVAVVGKIL